MSALVNIISDFKIYAAANLKIKTKKGSIKDFIFNDPQEYIHEQLQKQLSLTGKIRALILKGRQQGASTYTEGRFYWRTSTAFGMQAYILTHEQAATDNLFTMAKRYHDNSNELLKPETGTSNAKELLFSKLDSGYKVGTAGNKSVGRSGTIQFFHGSEVAFWNNADEHTSGVMQCVPEEDGTEIILESTANGVGGKFYQMWIEAVNGQSDYIAIFVPWFWSKEYRANADGLIPTPEEEIYKKRYSVDNEQLAWRRLKIKTLGKDKCDQEYPYCWLDAFLKSGRPVFDKEDTAKALDNCWSPIARMVLESGKFIERDKGELRVWEFPKQGKRYVIGGDVAEGLIHGDYSSLDVLDNDGNQCAQWHGHIAPDLLGIVAYHLGYFYNTALIGVECNNHGILTNVTLRDMGYPWLYVQKAIDDGYTANREQTRIGWQTTKRSKPLIIDQLSAELREETHGICCSETAVECQTYVVKDDGSYGSQQGAFDDRVMSYAIAKELIKHI